MKKDALMEIVEDILPNIYDQKQKRKKLSNLLQSMKKKDQTIDSRGKTSNAVWFSCKSK